MNFPARRKPLALLFCYGFAGVLAGAFAAEAVAQASTPLRVDPALLGLPATTPAQAPAPASTPEPAPTTASEPVPEPSAEVNPVEKQGVEAFRESDAPPDDEEAELRKRAKAAQSERVQKRTDSVSEAASLKAPARAPAAPVTAPPERAPVPQTAPTPASVVVPVAPAESVQRNREEPVASREPIPAPSTDNKASPVPTPAPTPAIATPVARKPEPVSAIRAAAPAMIHSGTSGAVSTLAPLRVDPALLGPLPATRTADVAQAGAQSNPADRRATASVLPQPATSLAQASATRPPQVPATGPRDEEEVPDDDLTPGLALRASKGMVPLDRNSPEPRPVFLSAQRMGGLVDREFVAEGDAQLRKTGTVLDADRLTYWPIDDEIEADGNVRLEQGDDRISGPKMRLKLEDQVGYFEQPSYTIKRQTNAPPDGALDALPVAPKSEGAWLTSGFESPQARSRFDEASTAKREATEVRGDAERLNFEGKNQFRLSQSTYTTCQPGDDAWYAKASELRLDYDREVGNADNATIYFKDIPILYSPWLSFSLNNQRKSGFLVPSFGTSSDDGVEISVPYYWNIAPNMDATITPRVMSRRGVQFENEFRYLNSAWGGLYRDKLRLEYLPNDRLSDGKKRWGVSLLHTQTTSKGFSGHINYNKVSDDDYYTDLSSGIAATSTTQLLQQGLISYAGGWWNASANFQQYQTLQPDPENPVREPYRMLPQLVLNARKPDWYMLDASVLGQFTHFTRPDQERKGILISGDSGQRTVLYPQLALPFVKPGWYVTPKLGLNMRRYSLSRQADGIPNSIGVTLPIFSVDSGMVFERASNWFGRDYTQTLEPRLYYLNIPYKDQSQIPLFDTGLADFNFAQIFSENQFSSWDRVNNANQLTAAVTSRLLEPDTGNEIMRATFGQRYYFTRNRVALDDTSLRDSDDRNWDRSDLLAAFSGQVLPRIYADAAVQYNLADREVKRYSMGAHYRPEPGKTLNTSYRYNRDSTAPLNQLDVSGQWPISGRWHAVGRLNYSFKDDATNLNNTKQGGRFIEAIAGLEYNAGCWAVRGVIQRTALTEDKKSSSFFVQLELTDFGRIGSNPLKLLKRNIQGYSQINDPESETGFDD